MLVTSSHRHIACHALSYRAGQHQSCWKKILNKWGQQRSVKDKGGLLFGLQRKPLNEHKMLSSWRVWMLQRGMIKCVKTVAINDFFEDRRLVDFVFVYNTVVHSSGYCIILYLIWCVCMHISLVTALKYCTLLNSFKMHAMQKCFEWIITPKLKFSFTV